MGYRNKSWSDDQSSADKRQETATQASMGESSSSHTPSNQSVPLPFPRRSSSQQCPIFRDSHNHASRNTRYTPSVNASTLQRP